MWTLDEFNQDPALAWSIEQSLIQSKRGCIGVMGGMGMKEQMLMLPSDAFEERQLIHIIQQWHHQSLKTWRGLDVRHIQRQLRNEMARPKAEYTDSFWAVDVLAALDGFTQRVRFSQAMFDFLTLRDVDDASVDIALVGEDVPSLLEYDKDKFDLLYAFQRQLIAEAEPCRHNVAVGMYVLERPALPAVDAEIVYDRMRLLILPQGIAVAVIRGSEYAPFCWTPDGINTSQVWVHPRAVFALDMMLACIWRDACIVWQGWATHSRKRGAVVKRGSDAKPIAAKLVLPRTVYVSQWGTETDHEAVAYISRQAHTVRGFYRVLVDGWQAHDADERAGAYGYPSPPDGYTFVRPHIRGEGLTNQHVKQVVCKGLQTAALMLN